MAGGRAEPQESQAPGPCILDVEGGTALRGKGGKEASLWAADQAPCPISLFAAVTGTILEFYDFSVYAFFAPEIGRLFFPKGSPALRAVSTFSIFAGGFLMRPVGSVLIGAIGDRFGTAAALRLSILLMALPTVGMGLLPPFAKIGAAAPALLTLLRLLQGLSVGGEFVGALLHMADSSPPQHRGFYSGVVGASVVFGNLLGALFSTLLRRHLSKVQMLEYGWRIPFLAGAVLALVGLFLRHRTLEEHPPEERHDQPTTFRALFKELATVDRLKLIRVMLLAAFNMTLFFTNFVWMGTYLATLSPHRIEPHHAFGVVCTLQVCFLLTNPLWGWAGDRTGYRLRWVLCSLALAVVAQPLLFLLLSTGNLHRIYSAGIVGAALLGVSLSGNFLAYMIEELLGVNARFVGLAVAYNIGAMIGGIYPTFASALSADKSVRVAPVLPVCLLGVLAFAVIGSGVMDARNKRRFPPSPEELPDASRA